MSDAISNFTTIDWLKVVLNEDVVDPRIDYIFKDSHVSQHTTQNSELAFPSVYRVESNSFQKKQEPFTSNMSSFSTNLLSKDLLVVKVVEVIGVILEEVKSDIWRTIINVNQGKANLFN